ncbi:hypothetical protein B1L11_39720 [Microbispora sp. GKU 823]|nr:hypothetical protein B1L11_39720 [Microbispora sp. GKU 823]
MREGVTVAGHRLTGRTRPSEVGTWADAVSPDGRPSGVLRFDPRAVATAEARERLVAAVGADVRLQGGGPIGLLPVIDLVAARDEVWLITARATPAVADLMAAGRLDPGGAATVLLETAQTLLAVHSAGSAHGALHAGTVVIGEDGSVLLAERGLLRALRGEHASAEQDVAAWVALAGALAANCGQGHAAAALRRADAPRPMGWPPRETPCSPSATRSPAWAGNGWPRRHTASPRPRPPSSPPARRPALPAERR